MPIAKYSELIPLYGRKPTRWKVDKVLRRLIRQPTWRPLLPGSIRTAAYMVHHGLLVATVGRSGHTEYEITERGAAFGFIFMVEDGDNVDG